MRKLFVILASVVFLVSCAQVDNAEFYTDTYKLCKNLDIPLSYLSASCVTMSAMYRSIDSEKLRLIADQSVDIAMMSDMTVETIKRIKVRNSDGKSILDNLQHMYAQSAQIARRHIEIARYCLENVNDGRPRLKTIDLANVFALIKMQKTTQLEIENYKEKYIDKRQDHAQLTKG